MECKYCNKSCKSKKSLVNHERLCKENPNRQIANVEAALAAMNRKVKCPHCEGMFVTGNIKKHEESCNKNPLVIERRTKECLSCGKPFIGEGVTCSYACSNKYFRSGPNSGLWKESAYRTTCFYHHKKECIICGENKIVEVHHLNEDRSDNRPENLVPLCPTHHQYFHSKYRDEVETKIKKYIAEWTWG